jgi:hypothetical protein
MGVCAQCVSRAVMTNNTFGPTMVHGSPALVAALFFARADASGILSQQLVAEVAAIRDTHRGAALPIANLQQPLPASRYTALMVSGTIIGDIIIGAPSNVDAAATHGHHGATHAPPCASNGLDAALPRANGAADNGGSRNNGAGHHHGAHAKLARPQPTGTGSPAPLDARSHYLYNNSIWNADALRAREEDGTESPIRTEHGRKAPSLGTCRCHAGGPARPYLRLDDMDALSTAASTTNHQGSGSGDGAAEETSPDASKGIQVSWGQPELLEPRASSKGGDGWPWPPPKPGASSRGGDSKLWLVFFALAILCLAEPKQSEPRREQEPHKQLPREIQPREQQCGEQQQSQQQQQQPREQQLGSTAWMQPSSALRCTTACLITGGQRSNISCSEAHRRQVQQLMDASEPAQVDWDYIITHAAVLTPEQRDWAYELCQWVGNEVPSVTVAAAVPNTDANGGGRRRRRRGKRGGRGVQRSRRTLRPEPLRRPEHDETGIEAIMRELGLDYGASQPAPGAPAGPQLLPLPPVEDPWRDFDRELELRPPDHIVQPNVLDSDAAESVAAELDVASSDAASPDAAGSEATGLDAAAADNDDAAATDADAASADAAADADAASADAADADADDAAADAAAAAAAAAAGSDNAEADAHEMELFSPGGTSIDGYEPMDEPAFGEHSPGGTSTEGYLPLDSSEGIGHRVRERHEALRAASDSIAARVCERRRTVCSVETDSAPEPGGSFD